MNNQINAIRNNIFQNFGQIPFANNQEQWCCQENNFTNGFANQPNEIPFSWPQFPFGAIPNFDTVPNIPNFDTNSFVGNTLVPTDSTYLKNIVKSISFSQNSNNQTNNPTLPGSGKLSLNINLHVNFGGHKRLILTTSLVEGNLESAGGIPVGPKIIFSYNARTKSGQVVNKDIEYVMDTCSNKWTVDKKIVKILKIFRIEQSEETIYELRVFLSNLVNELMWQTCRTSHGKVIYQKYQLDVNHRSIKLFPKEDLVVDYKETDL